MARWAGRGRSAETSDDAASSWEARPGLARAIRVVVVLSPIVLGGLAAIFANRVLERPASTAAALFRSFEIVTVATLIVWGVDRFARKLLPLAALMQLSLVFPDKAPSRFRAAVKSGSSRSLERTLDETRRHGLADDPGDAARQVVQLIGAIGDHDRRTRGHSERVRLYADLIGQEMKLSKEDRQKLQWGALLHDLGKLMVPGEILNKKGKPDADEWAILEGHPAEGMRLIEPLRPFLGEWVHAIGGHHEKWDGSGYPLGLTGERIPRAAAIVAVADSFEVMTAIRSYKKAMPLPEARAELTRCAGTHFSPEVVRAFLSISLGHLRLISGPLAALAHVPFLGQVAQLPGAIAATAPVVTTAAVVPAAAAAVTTMALAVGAVPTPPETVAIKASPEATAPARRPELAMVDESTTTTTTATGSADTSATTTTSSPGAAPVDSAHAATTTTTKLNGVAATTSTTTAAGSTARPAAPAATAAPTTAPGPAPTAAPTTAPPTIATTVATTTTTTTPVTDFVLMYSMSGARTNAAQVNGARIPAGTTIYGFVPSTSNLTRIDFTYPGGSRSEYWVPFDFMGTAGNGNASPWQVPTTAGTYTITATGIRSVGDPIVYTATFVAT